MSGTSRRAMSLTSSSGISTGGQTYSMIRFHSRRCSDGRRVRACADRVEAGDEHALDLGQGDRAALLVADRGEVAHLGDGDEPFVGSGCSLPTQSKRWTSPDEGSRRISKFSSRHICSRRAIIGCSPRNLTSSSNVAGVGPVARAIQYGLTPSSPGRRNVNTSRHSGGVGGDDRHPSHAAGEVGGGELLGELAGQGIASRRPASGHEDVDDGGVGRLDRRRRAGPRQQGRRRGRSSRARAARTWTVRSWRS